MKHLVVLFILLSANIAQAGDITGTVTILEKNGKKALKSFSNAVVYLEGIETPAPSEPVTIDQKDKTFVPRLSPVIKGQEIRILNADPVQHNIFSPHEQEPFDLGHYPKGESKSVKLNTLGRHRIYCNIHQNMIGDILVLPNQYFAVTDEKGHYTIKDVPPGKYTIRVWHVLDGSDAKEIAVTNDPVELNFTVTSQQIIRDITNHLNKSGQKYQQPQYGY
jgi:plastocyanin